MKKGFKLTEVLLLLVLSAVVLVACGGGGGDSAPPEITGTLRLTNSSVAPIDHLYFSPTSQALWGPDQLTATLQPGTEIDIVDIPANTYDAKVIAGGVYSIYSGYLFNIPITAGSTFYLFAFDSSFTGSLKIVNNTLGANIIGLYVTPNSSSSWGVNQITSSISPSGSMHLYDMPPDDYDVKVVWDIGTDSFYYGKSIQSLTLLTLYVN